MTITILFPERFTVSLNLLPESPFYEGHWWRKGKLPETPVEICPPAGDCTHLMPTHCRFNWAERQGAGNTVTVIIFPFVSLALSYISRHF